MSAALRVALPESRVVVETGLFGDLIGSIDRAGLSSAGSAVVVIEWGDLDPRLAIRTLGGWKPAALSDIVDSATEAGARLDKTLIKLSRRMPTVLCMPTLPLPPLFATRPAQASSFELNLRRAVASLAASLSECEGLRIANTQLLNEASPEGERYDVKSDVVTGFPYALPHASVMGDQLAGLIHNRQPKKGLITDLDDTLWAGIVGEDGVDGVSWSLDRGHMHGLYQQFVASLAGAGVLVGVASKNEAAVVKRAFDRSDLLLSRNDIFPFETQWSRKSESVERILKTWNVGADSVVFVDDSPMEVAEVKAAFPQMECIVFPKKDYPGIWNLLRHLRDVFGKPFLTDEDAIRLHSLRATGASQGVLESAGRSSDDFLQASEACVIFEPIQPAGDARAFELVNKTNQFNLNGKRFNEAEWQSIVRDPAAVRLSVSYKDKYGPLGKIAVVLGRILGPTFQVNAWVLSCRAFSRRIEHLCLKYLFETLGVDEIEFDYQVTARNGPLQQFFTELLGRPAVPPIALSREQFTAHVPELFHRVEGTIHV
ncbi:MAG TPA: HAD-IIIC family phosphatase [Terriglobales bacterium]|nr:HAD-IIIC family phosphatase [Terriglobales bacterium]